MIHIVYPPLGIAALERFAASYRAHPAGPDHRLVLLLKGAAERPFADRCATIATDLAAESLAIADDGLDLDSYLAAARQLDSTMLCFLNSSSEILSDGWLSALSAGLSRPGTGIAGATASNESALSAAPRPLRPVLHSRYPPFPNPHIRTNAFMLRRALMMKLSWPATTRKRRALVLESGKQSITSQIAAMSLAAVVVGRDGRCYERESWFESRTFRSGSQENLLIADNRTREYEHASPDRRAQLARLAWGEQR